MSTIGSRLKEAREKKGLLQSELAKMIGVKSAGVISNWEQDVSKPDANKMVKLCQVLGISLSYLLDYYGEEKAPPYSSEAMKLAKDYDGLDWHGKRVIRLVADEETARCEAERQANIKASIQEQKTEMEAAGEIEPDVVLFVVPYFLQPASAGTGDEVLNDVSEDLELKKRPPRGTSYVIRLDGNSMEPTFQNGDKLFIHSCTEIRPGQIGVFLMDGKQWIKELGDNELISHNAEEYGPIPMREDIRCQGIVLGTCDESYFE